MSYIHEIDFKIFMLGIGDTQLAEFSAGVEIPYLSSKIYKSIETILQDDIKDTAWVVMKAAGDEERKLAIQSGSVYSDGIPLITVVADAQWSKRSYRTKYDAFSGVVRQNNEII